MNLGRLCRTSLRLWKSRYDNCDSCWHSQVEQPCHFPILRRAYPNRLCTLLGRLPTSTQQSQQRKHLVVISLCQSAITVNSNASAETLQLPALLQAFLVKTGTAQPQVLYNPQMIPADVVLVCNRKRIEHSLRKVAPAARLYAYVYGHGHE